MPVKMIVSDIDGTLVGKSGKLTKRLIDALNECKKRNIHVVLASGRTFYGAREIALEAGIDCPIISANGGRCDMFISGEEKPVYEDTLDKETSMKVYGILKEAGCFMTSYVGKNIYALNETNGFGSKGVKTSEVFKEPNGHVIMDDEKRFYEEGTNVPYKYEAYTDDVSLMDKLRNELSAMGLSVSSAFPFNLEILSPGGGKGKAIVSLAKIFGIDINDVMAMGDGSNDLGMISVSGYSVAMGNAVEVLKKAAKYIAPDVDEDGAAIMIEKLALSEE